MFIEKSVKEFLDELAAKKSTPGGGGAAALVGALAVALTSMVGNFSIDKKGYEQNWQELGAMLFQAEELRSKLAELVELDAQVFGQLMAAYKMSKNTEEEIFLRNKTLEGKIKNAASVPLQIAHHALAVQRLALIALQKGNRELSSDAILSGILGYAALRSASYNVLINLNISKDQTYIEKSKEELKALLLEGGKLEKEIVALGDKDFAI